MPVLEVRPFRRADRDQLTDLVNTHVAAVVPGVSGSVDTVLSDLERQPGEFVTDPWVAERTTLVAERREYVVAAAHLLRHRADAEVGESHRDAAGIDWCVCRPAASFRPDADQAAGPADAGVPGTVRPLERTRPVADGALPAPLVHGLPHHARAAGLAGIGNLRIDPVQYGTGLEYWLLCRAADWLRLCGVDRLVGYEPATDTTMLGHLAERASVS